MSSSVKPVVPTTACMPCIASHGTVTRAASATGEVDDDIATGVGQRPQITRQRDPVAGFTDRLAVDRGDEFEIVVQPDGDARGSAHLSARTDNTDLDLRHAASTVARRLISHANWTDGDHDGIGGQTRSMVRLTAI